MILDEVIVPIVCSLSTVVALQLSLSALANFRRSKPSVSPSRALGLLDSHPYRALQTSQAPDVVAGCVALSDEAVRRERARVLAIVRAVGETAEYDGEERIIKGIADGINSGA